MKADSVAEEMALLPYQSHYAAAQKSLVEYNPPAIEAEEVGRVIS